MKAADFALKTVSALVGLFMAMVVYTTFGFVRIESAEMMPVLEPGKHVLVEKNSDSCEYNVGDIIVYEVPFFDINEEGRYAVRRIAGKNDDVLEVGSEQGLLRGEKEIVNIDKIFGKVIWNG